jgi:hypothetical protein
VYIALQPPNIDLPLATLDSSMVEDSGDEKLSNDAQDSYGSEYKVRSAHTSHILILTMDVTGIRAVIWRIIEGTGYGTQEGI